MKNFKTLFGMAVVVGLMAAACTNDVNEVLAPEAPAQQGYHFIGTIAPKTFDATTRTLLTENADGTLSSTWQVGDIIGLGHNTISGDEVGVEVVAAKVTAVAADCSATIEATLSNLPYDDGEPNGGVWYPYGSSEWDFISKQDGTLSAALDLRSGSAYVKVDDDNNITFANPPSLDAAVSIFKFTMTDSAGNDVNVDKLVISSKGYYPYDEPDLEITVDLKKASNVVYVAMYIEEGEHTFTFEATSGSATYKTEATANSLETGKFYKTSLKLTKEP